MAWNLEGSLTTRRAVQAPAGIAQVILSPSGRVDKVTLYLEPIIGDEMTLSSSTIEVRIYAESAGFPTGSALATAMKTMDLITKPGLYNFDMDCATGTTSAIVLTGGNSTNYVSWRFLPGVDDGSLPASYAANVGSPTWVAEVDARRYTFSSYIFQDSLDTGENRLVVQAGTQKEIVDDTQAEFEDGVLVRTKALGNDTVVLKVDDVVATIVVDQSGSMGWNDPGKDRFALADDVITNIDSAVSGNPPSIARFSLLRFGAMPIDDIIMYEEGSRPRQYNVRVLRKASGFPSSPQDTTATVVYDGIANKTEDGPLTSSVSWYAAYTYDKHSAFSDPVYDKLITTGSDFAPMGVARFLAEENILLTLGKDVGDRTINLSWIIPTGSSILSVAIIRRDDRPPNSFYDGGVVVGTFLPAVTSFVDVGPFCNGLTYYYKAFTIGSGGVYSSSESARDASVPITMADRSWELDNPPVAPTGFDITAPGVPVVSSIVEGDASVSISWTGDLDSLRFRVYYKTLSLPVQQPDGTYDGEVVFDGSSTSFFHYDLENAQPHFYAIQAYDKVGNKSIAATVTARPTEDSTTFVPPPPVQGFHADRIGADTSLVSFVNPSRRTTGITGYFDEQVVVHAEALTRSSSFKPDGTTFGLSSTTIDGTDTRTVVGTGVSASSAIRLESTPTSEETEVVGGVTASPSITTQNSMTSASLSVRPSFYILDNDTGSKVVDIGGASVDVTLSSPFAIGIFNEPAQNVSRRTWRGVVTSEDGTKTKVGYEVESLPGVYVSSNDSFDIVVEASLNGLTLDVSLTVNLSVLDKVTLTPSSVVSLPGAISDGSVNLVLQTQSDEIIDRTGQPSGEFRQRTMARLSIPPQVVPGEYVIRVTGALENYTYTKDFSFYAEPTLNVDLNLSPFLANGSDVSQQIAYVYSAPFDSVQGLKTPVVDGVVVDWSATCVAGCPTDGQSRPFYGTEALGGGVRSATSGGTAKNVFFGPGLDVDPNSGADAAITRGELYEVRAIVQLAGQTAVGYGFVDLVPLEQSNTFARIFLRRVSGFNSDVIPADGIQTSRWEVLADPSSDSGGASSGSYFYQKVIGSPINGQVPALADGSVVTLVVEHENGYDAGPVTIKTNLVPDGRLGVARATVSGGKAVFDVLLNKPIGGLAQKASASLPKNVIYGASDMSFPSAPSVYSVRASTSVPTLGQVVVYHGGGSDLKFSTPPCFVGFTEPLGG